MKISVLMPVKNAANTVARAIRSIQSQSFTNWELIIVDDHSTDSTLQIVHQFTADDHRIRPTSSVGQGITDALNFGISHCKGRYLARMDADDVSLPDRLASQFSFLNENRDVGLVATRVNFKGDSALNAGYANYVDWTNRLINWPDIRANRFVESPFAHPSVMFRRSLIKASTNCYRSGDFPEDYELWLRWMDAGIKMTKLPEYLVDWYDTPNRLSRTDRRYAPAVFFHIKAQYLATWLKRTLSKYRPIWIWGAGRITRTRVELLVKEGISFTGYIDVDPRKIGKITNDLPVISYKDIPVSTQPYIISYIGNRGARDDIRNYLLQLGLKEEVDFIIAA